MQLLDPLTIQEVALSAGGVLGVRSVDQAHVESPLLKQLEQRDPEHACGLHRDGTHAMALEPVRQLLQVTGQDAEFPHRLIAAVRRHRHPVTRVAQVDPGGVGMNQLESRRVRLRAPALAASLRILALCSHLAPPKKAPGRGRKAEFFQAASQCPHLPSPA